MHRARPYLNESILWRIVDASRQPARRYSGETGPTWEFELSRKNMFLIMGHTIIHNTTHYHLPISILNFPKAILYNRSHPHFSIHLPKNSIISQNLFSIFSPHYKIPLLITLLLTLPPLKSTQIPSPPKNPTHHYIP